MKPRPRNLAILSVPLIREGRALGAIMVRAQERAREERQNADERARVGQGQTTS
jgi:hypothetical protein